MGKALIILAPGGLGNQLFTVAAALHISEKKQKLIFVLSDSRELVNKFRRIRNSGIAPIKLRVVYSKKLNLWLNKISSHVSIIAKDFPKIEKFIIRKFRTELVPWKFPNEILQTRSPSFWILRGYFQDIDLLNELSASSTDALARLLDFDLTTEPLDRTTELKSVGVHVRRGDYASIPDYGVLSTSYFQRLISHYSADNSLVMIASDDSSIFETFRVKGSSIFLDAKSFSPLETMKILGKSDVFIMSNSTFSFWIGWLVSLKGGIVIRPNPWFKANDVPENYLLLNKFIDSPSQFEE